MSLTNDHLAPTKLCQAVNRVTGIALNTAVTVTDGSAPSEASTLQNKASLSASFLGIASGNTKVDFGKRIKITSTSNHIVILAEKSTKYSLVDRSLEPGIDVENMKEFSRKYGDSYLLLVYLSRGGGHQDQVSAKWNLRGKMSVDASLQTKFDELRKSTTIRSTLEKHVVGVKAATPPSDNNIMGYPQEFLAMPVDAPEVLSYGTSEYETAVGWEYKEDLSCLCRNRDYLLNELVPVWASLRTLSLQIDDIVSIYNPAFIQADDTLLQRRREVQGIIHLFIDATFTTYAQDPTTPLTNYLSSDEIKQNNLPVLFNGTPSLSISFDEVWHDQKGRELGHGGGNHFNDIEAFGLGVRHHLTMRIRISATKLRSGRVNDGLSTFYQSEQWNNGQGYERVLGGNGGNDYERRMELHLQDGTTEVITRIHTFSATRGQPELHRVEITTSDGTMVCAGERWDHSEEEAD